MDISKTLFDQITEENRQQREIIRELLQECVETEKYWKSFVLKVLQQQSETK